MSMRNELLQLSELFKALGDPTRLRLIRLLASNMEERLCVVDLAQKLGISQPAASQHLKVLKHLKILHIVKERPRIYYSLDLIELRKQKERLDQLFEFAFTKCSQGGQCQDCPHIDLCDHSET